MEASAQEGERHIAMMREKYPEQFQGEQESWPPQMPLARDPARDKKTHSKLVGLANAYQRGGTPAMSQLYDKMHPPTPEEKAS